MKFTAFVLHQSSLPFSSMTYIFLESGLGERTDTGNLPTVESECEKHPEVVEARGGVVGGTAGRRRS